VTTTMRALLLRLALLLVLLLHALMLIVLTLCLSSLFPRLLAPVSGRRDVRRQRA